MSERYRVLDWNTPWFWVVAFHRRSVGSAWLEVSIFGPSHRWLGNWFRIRQGWEPEPDTRGHEAISPLSPSPRKATGDSE